MQTGDDRVKDNETIVAISTPPGRGGIGIVRLSGARAKGIAEGLVRLKGPLEAGRARFGEVVENVGGIADGVGTHISESRCRVPGVLRPTHDDETVMDGAPVAGGAGTEKDEMRGSLHCAALTRSSGRDDDSFGGAGRGGEVVAGALVGGVSRGDGDAGTGEADPPAAPKDDKFRRGGRVEGASVRVLDEAVVTYFAGPRSYTGEDVVEIAAHGSPVLLDALVRRAVAAGARMAEPGEFTQRAFFAGRIDLTQAEAVDDLIRATTLEQARSAARQMGGGLSRQVRPVKERLIGLIAEMEAGIDFAEDDLEVMAEDAVLAALREIEAPLREMEESFAYGRVLREGFKLAIVGRPNAGKSSLFNRLVRRERAIVTAQPGTTRDPVAEQMEFAGIPVEVVDTAGLRVAADEAEAMGVAKSREAMAEADVVLLVVAADAGLHEEDWAVLRRVGGAVGGVLGGGESRETAAGSFDKLRTGPSTTALRAFAQDDTLLRGETGLVLVWNKLDLVGEWGTRKPTHRGEVPEESHISEARCGAPGMKLLEGLMEVETSAVEGTGIEELRAAVLAKLKAIAPGADTAPVTNLRQHAAIAAAVGAVRAARAGGEAGVPHEMVLLDLHEALGALDQLTGTTHTEEILGVIFSRFCIGK